MRYVARVKIPLQLQGDCPVIVSGTSANQDRIVPTTTTLRNTFFATKVSFNDDNNDINANVKAMHVDDDSVDLMSINEGVIVTEVGPEADFLKALGLKPSVGDVVYSVNDDVVTHLNTSQLKRLLWKKYKGAKAQYCALGILRITCLACDNYRPLL